MTLKNWLFGLSVFLNVVAIFYVATHGAADLSRDSMDDSLNTYSSSSAELTVEQIDSGIEKLRTLVSLRNRFSVDGFSPNVRYWESAADAMQTYRDQQSQSVDAVRRELMGLYGDEAIQEPLFSSYFFPLGPGFDFLTSAEQLQVLDARTEYQQRRLARSGMGAQSFGEFQRAQNDYFSKLADILDEEKLFEYQLRESQFAQQLRNSGFPWSEYEFREVYRVLSEVNGEVGMASASSAQSPIFDDARVEQILGESRYRKYLATVDPSYSRFLTRLATNSADDELVDAYRLYTSFQRDISVALQQRDFRQVRELQLEQKKALADNYNLQVLEEDTSPFSTINSRTVVQ